MCSSLRDTEKQHVKCGAVPDTSVQAVVDAKLCQLHSIQTMPQEVAASAPDMLGPVTRWKLEQSSMYVALACRRRVLCICGACVKVACMVDVSSINCAGST